MHACQGKAGCPAIWWKPEEAVEATEATDERIATHPWGPWSLLRLAARALPGSDPTSWAFVG